MNGNKGTVIMTGIVGSRAYGWATEDSDTDRHGIFALPTDRFLGLNPPTAEELSYRPDADTMYHEVGHFMRLALKCNPSALELMFLPEALWEETSSFWWTLVNSRRLFLSAGAVSSAYLGFAREQYRRMVANSERDDIRQQNAKLARHMRRALIQGLELYRSGELTVSLGDREGFYTFGESAASDRQVARGLLEGYAKEFAVTKSPLPEHPQPDVLEARLIRERRRLLNAS